MQAMDVQNNSLSSESTQTYRCPCRASVPRHDLEPMTTIDQLRQDTERLKNSSGVDSFLSLKRSEDGLILEGNASGLLHLAAMLLQLAARPVEGAHIHLDAASSLDEAEASLVIGIRQAP